MSKESHPVGRNHPVYCRRTTYVYRWHHSMRRKLNIEANDRGTLTVVLVGDGYDRIRAVLLRDGCHVFKPCERHPQFVQVVHRIRVC